MNYFIIVIIVITIQVVVELATVVFKVCLPGCPV